MLDIVDRGRERPLKRGNHAAGHLIRRQPGEIPDHRDDRDSDFWEDVDGGARGGERADNQKQ